MDEECVPVRRKPGPKPGTAGARRVSEAHPPFPAKAAGRAPGSHEHDRTCGFAADRERASRAGKIGAARVRERYGVAHYQRLGAAGGKRMAERYGREHMAEIGRQAAEKRWHSASPEAALRETAALCSDPAVREIPLPGGRAALVDADVWAWAHAFEWRLYRQRYVCRTVRHPDGRRERVLLHREVLQAGPAVWVEHKNRNPLDNRRANLKPRAPSRPPAG